MVVEASWVGTTTGSSDPLVEAGWFCPKPSLGGRGPSSPSGPIGPLRGSEYADKSKPPMMQIWAPP
eukprot:6458762-Alexandrium_andersonii.AAC.1